MTGTIEIKTVDEKIQDFADIVFVIDGQRFTALDLFKLAAADKARIDFLQERGADTIRLGDGGLIDVAGLDVREAIDCAMALPMEEHP